MQAMSADPREPEPTPRSRLQGGLGTSHLNNGLLEKFAQNMTENIIQSFTSQMELGEPEVSRFNQNHETLAEGLASAVIEVPLREPCRGHNVEGPRSVRVKMKYNQSDCRTDLLVMDTEIDPGKEILIPKDKSGLAPLGSHDYLAAPLPSPELEIPSSRLNNGLLERYAQKMTENIIQSSVSQMETREPGVDFGVSRWNENQELLAAGLASAVIEVAMRELCRGQKGEDRSKGPRSDVVEMDGQVSESQRYSSDMDTEVAPGKEIQTSKGVQPCHSNPYRSMLHVKESLDYPDAPPASPLFSEFESSWHLNNGPLEKFAHKMTENIIQSFIRQKEVVEPGTDFGLSRCNENQEMLAEGLASAVMEVALREACRRQNENNFDGSDHLEGKRDFAHPSHPPLSQSGLPILGSLDYPDAPPTSPLLPELERSRHSFARKLKGGLAKVFLPSPPPPTPKDKEDHSDIETREELMKHLLHSLPIDDSLRDDYGAKMEALAEALSCDIVSFVLREQLTDGGALHLLAHRLAQTIITSSLHEACLMF